MKKSGYRATEILPPGSTGADLQAAIDRAVFGDVIQLSGDMTFTDTVTVRQFLEITITSTTGNSWVMSQTNPNIRHFAIDGSLILENIILDGGNSGGGVQLNQGSFATLDGAVIRNCAAVSGGGVHVVSGMFSIYGGIIEQNTAERGGGVYMANGSLNFSAITGVIRNNTATESGGGVYIENGITLSLSAGEISANEAPQGGGMYVNSGTFAMSRGVFSNNTASENGGALYVSAQGAVTISGSNSSIASNNAVSGNGGGIYTADTSYANITTDSNVVFRCNKASAAYTPPPAATYPNIQFASATIANHPLNNFDINYTVGEPIAAVFNVTYHANGGEGNHVGPDILPCETDTVLALADTQISREGYNFVGWNTAADGGGVSYAPGDIITLSDNIVLYAQWQANVHTVIYGANGGSGAHVDTDVPYGTEYTILTQGETGISREGYAFGGWNTEPDGGGVSYAPGAIITISGDILLYAQWTANLYTVVYEANGGSGAHSDADILHGTEYTILTLVETAISREGYTFTGWNTAADGSGVSHAPGATITITDNITLHAQWAVNLYTITYGANGGSGGYSDTNIPYGTAHTVLSVEATAIRREGHTFTGWNTEPDGSGVSHVPGEIITVTDDIFLYAQWQANLYTITYEANGGCGTHLDTDIPHGTEYMILIPSETGIIRKGYRFIGWNTEPDGSGISHAPGDVIVLTGSMTLYAQWEPFMYMVVYKTDCGSGGHVDTDIPYGSVYTVLTPVEAGISRKGYCFVCWNTESDGSGASCAPGDAITLISNMTFYAQWKSNDTPCSNPCSNSCSNSCSSSCGKPYSDPCKKPYCDLCSKIFKKSSCRPDSPQ